MITMSDNENLQIKNKKSKCPKCHGFNTLTVGEGKDQSFYCLDCNYAEGLGTEESR